MFKNMFFLFVERSKLTLLFSNHNYRIFYFISIIRISSFDFFYFLFNDRCLLNSKKQSTRDFDRSKNINFHIIKYYKKKICFCSFDTQQ